MKKQKGVALLIEMLIVASLMLVLAAALIPSVQKAQNAANTAAARTRVMQVGQLMVAQAICNASTNPFSNACNAVNSLIPNQPMTNTQGYQFILQNQFTPDWSYTGKPMPGTSIVGGESFYIDRSGIMRCSDAPLATGQPAGPTSAPCP